MSPKESKHPSLTQGASHIARHHTHACNNINARNNMDALQAKFLIACISLTIGIPLGASAPALAQQPPEDISGTQPVLISQSIDAEVLQLQDSGSAVEQLQSQLSTLGYYDGPITGFFGTLTEDAVIRFQQATGLVADGIVGSATQTALERSLNARSQSFNTTSAPIDDGLLQLEDQGEQVTTLQTRLQELGYYDAAITGFFGPLTEDAVIRFQRDRGLTPDGIVGPATQTALSRRVTSNLPTVAPATTPSAQVAVPSTSFSTTNDGLLQRGDSGTAVANLQNRLRELGFYTGTVSGQFDAETEAAVIAFQRSQGLTADGIVGTQTASSLRLTDIQDPQGGRYSVLELQRRLRDLRLYSGPLDGRLGEETRAAIQAAQSRFSVSESDIVNGRF